MIIGGPSALLALLAVPNKGVTAPLLRWVELIRADLDVAFASKMNERIGLPDPRSDSRAWFACARFTPQKFDNIIDSIFFTHSVCDSDARGLPIGTLNPLTFNCSSCGTSFSSNKALTLHCQSFHGRRREMRFYAPASGECAVCGVKLGSRLRLLKHLSDKRRPGCRDKIKEVTSPLPFDVVVNLDNADRLARQAARHAGSSYVPAGSQAFRVDGKLTGVCRA